MKIEKTALRRILSTAGLLLLTLAALSIHPEKNGPPAEAAETEEPAQSPAPFEGDVLPLTQNGSLVEYGEIGEQTERAAPAEDMEPEPPEQKAAGPEPEPEPEKPRVFADGLGNPLTDYAFGQPVPESEPVKDSWFSDAAFIGNSLEQGFMIWGELFTADYFATQSISIGNIYTEKAIPVSEEEAVTILEALSEKQYGKVYIMLGLNEVDWEEDAFVEGYEALIGAIREQQPETEIYLQSITPLAVKFDANPEKFSKEKVLRFNELIRQVAEESESHFLYIYECMADENGDLPEGASIDGIHPYSPYYRKWHAYLNAHTVQEVTE